MDYKIFAKENYHITALASWEIENPIAGLKEFLIGKSAEQLKRHVGDLLFAVFEKHRWRQYGAPVNLYVKARELAKLMDFVWLITTCEIGAQNKIVSLDGYYLTDQYQRRTFDKLFIKTRAKNKAKPVALGDMARAIFQERHGLLMKDDIEAIWLGVALNSSHMGNLATEFHCIDSSTDVQDYWYMMTIIDCAFELTNGPAPRLDAEKLKYCELFASDVDHPDCLFEEDMELLFKKNCSVFWYIDEVKFPKAIRKWFSLISTTDHWENHNDPGNILFIKDCIQQIVETAWLRLRVGFPKLCNREVNRKHVMDLSTEQIADPIAYIGHFFEQHRLHEWKRLLDTWLSQSLSDENHIDTEVEEQDCEAIIKLIQASRLIERRA